MLTFVRAAVIGLAALIAVPALAQGAFPVTITHVYGETVISAQPKRVVVWGTKSQDAVFQLGVMPVGIPFFSYGGGDNGILPWDEEAIAKLGGEPPVILPNGNDGIPIEKIAALRPDLTRVDGHISMQKRPNKDLVEALRALGAELDSRDGGYLPTSVKGTRALRGPACVSGTMSSQYLTSLLIVAPLIEGGLTIEVQGDLTSKPYLDLTLDEMAKFGVRVENQDYRRLVVAQQSYRAGTIDVEGDASAASYFAALATLHGASIRLTNLGSGTRQGDYAFLALCEKLGARVTSISVRPMTTKWASYSTTGRLTFDVLLLELREELQDYVIAHELLHFNAPNHGKLWKSLMRAHLGEYEQLEDQLRQVARKKAVRVGASSRASSPKS